jgi:hypothetical protein
LNEKRFHNINLKELDGNRSVPIFGEELLDSPLLVAGINLLEAELFVLKVLGDFAAGGSAGVLGFWARECFPFPTSRGNHLGLCCVGCGLRVGRSSDGGPDQESKVLLLKRIKLEQDTRKIIKSLDKFAGIKRECDQVGKALTEGPAPSM